VSIDNKEFPGPAAQSQNVQNAQQKGVFLLSNPEDVLALLHSLQGKAEEHVDKWQATRCDQILPANGRSDLSSHFQAVEEHLERQEASFAQGMRMIINELTSLRQILEHEISEQKYTRGQRQDKVEKNDDRMLELIQAIIEKNSQDKQRSSWLYRLIKY